MLPLSRPRRFRAGRTRRSDASFPRPSETPTRTTKAQLPTSDGRGLRFVLVVAPVVALAVGVAGVAMSLIGSPAEIVTAVVLPLAILAALGLGGRPGPRMAAAIGLDLEAVLTGAVSPASMAFAMVLPLIAFGLVRPILRDRALVAAFAISA